MYDVFDSWDELAADPTAHRGVDLAGDLGDRDAVARGDETPRASDDRIPIGEQVEGEDRDEEELGEDSQQAERAADRAGSDQRDRRRALQRRCRC